MSDQFIADLHRRASQPIIMGASERADIERGISRALNGPRRSRRMRWVAGSTAVALLGLLGAKYGPALCADTAAATEAQVERVQAEWARGMDQAKRRFMPFSR